MSQLLTELLDLFSLQKGSILTANRKTLNFFLDKTKFQERRKAFFEACCPKGKKKSRVALCKKKKRPDFATNLSTVPTKKLRTTILEFMKELGLDKPEALRAKSEKQLARLARKKHWEAVLFLSDRSAQTDFEDSDSEQESEEPAQDKKGAGWEEHHRVTAEQDRRLEELQRRASELAEQKAAENEPVERRRGRARARTPPPKRRRRGPRPGTKYKKTAKVITGRDDEGQFQYQRQRVDAKGQPIDQWPASVTISQLPLSDVPTEVSSLPEQEFEHEFEHEVPIGIYRPTEEQKEAERKKPRTKRKTAVSGKKDRPKPVITSTGVLEKDPQKIPIAKLDKLPEGPKDESEDVIRSCQTTEQKENNCDSCEPDSLDRIRLSKTQRKELNRMKTLRKLTCEKLALAKCQLDLQRYLAMLWESHSKNTNGDYFAELPKNPQKKLNEMKTLTDPQQRAYLKALLANQNETMRLKKGHDDLQKRFRNHKKKLNQNYTLPSFRYDQLLDEANWSNDVFSKTALKNRGYEPPLEGKTVCKEIKIPKLIEKPKSPEKKPAVLVPDKLPSKKPETTQKIEEKTLEENVQSENPMTDDPSERRSIVMRDEAPPDIGLEHEDFPTGTLGRQRTIMGSQDVDLTRQEPHHHSERFLSTLPPEIEQGGAQSVSLHDLAPPPEFAPPPPTNSPRSVVSQATHVTAHSELDLFPQQRGATSPEPPALPPIAQPSPERQAPEPNVPVTEQLGAGTQQSPLIVGHVRTNAPMMLPHTPVFGGQGPGALRKLFDKEAPELNSQMALVTPEKKSIVTRGVQKGSPPFETKRLQFMPPPLNIGLPEIREDESLKVKLDRATREFQAAADREVQLQRQYREQFKRPLGVQRLTLRGAAETFEELESTKLMTRGLATRIFTKLAPIVSKVDWIDRGKPIAQEAMLTSKAILDAQRSYATLTRQPRRFSTQDLIQLLHVVAPKRVATRRMVLDLMLRQIAQASRQKKESSKRMDVLQASLWAQEHEHAPASESSSLRRAGGFRSRVSAFLKKKKKKPRKKQKKKSQKPRKMKPKKLESVMKPEPKVVVHDVKSPRIRKKSPKVAAGFVLKRKNKRNVK